MNLSKPLKQKNERVSTLLAFALIPLSGFATDVYIPSLPSMAIDLNITEIQVQFTLTLFLISYGISQLFVGSLLDSFGRYSINLYSLLVFTIASLVIANTGNIYLIYLMRVVHGITVGAIVVSKRAYFVDLFSGTKLKNYLSMFSVIWATAPIIAPFAGGYLQSYLGWQANFYFLAIFSTIIFLLELIYSGETIRQKMPFDLKTISKVYGDMIKTGSFTLGIIMLGLSYSMVMIYNMTGPFVIEHHFHLSPLVAGYSSLILGGAVMVGGILGKATIEYPFNKKLFINLGLQFIFVIAMLFAIGIVSNIYVMVFFAFLIHACSGYSRVFWEPA